jgi:hypothetical protein
MFEICIYQVYIKGIEKNYNLAQEITKDSIISLKFICFHLWLLTFKKKRFVVIWIFFSFLKKIKKNGS